MISRSSSMIYFAGTARNWELAGWYLWKLRKISWVVADGSVVEYRGIENYDVADLTQQMLWPALTVLDSAVEAKDEGSFQAAYQTLINTCNGCHQISEHGFVEILVPDRPTHRNQKYDRGETVSH
jgi:hypothetical protein